MNKEVIIDTNKFKKVHVTIQYVFRANFNDTYYLEELIFNLDDLNKEKLNWFDPYNKRSKINNTLVAIKYVSIPVKLFPNIPNKKVILSIDAIAEPSICIVAPIGSVVLATSSSIPILFAHSKLDGRDASEEQVPRDVTVGVKIFL